LRSESAIAPMPTGRDQNAELLRLSREILDLTKQLHNGSAMLQPAHFPCRIRNDADAP
jgi:hypothetical protein